MIEPLRGEVTDNKVIIAAGQLTSRTHVSRYELMLENLAKSADRNNRNDNI
jgi:hypothetical protein